MSKTHKAKRQYHPRARRAATTAAQKEDVITRGTAAIFITAAVRLLELEHDWERAAAVAFGDRLAAAATTLANELLDTARRTPRHGDAAESTATAGDARAVGQVTATQPATQD